jgi:hypothetical protein
MGHTPRVYGPLARFDPHTPPPGAPDVDPDGRTVLYAGVDLATSACEVFGETEDARVCPAWRVALLRPTNPVWLFDLCAPGSALAIGALPALADADLSRPLTQEWARAIYEDDPIGAHVTGVHYRSGYNGGEALALWDSSGLVETVEVGGVVADLPLSHPDMIRRLFVVLAPRRIMINLIDAAACHLCP